jgi:DNA-binding transcriptional regulator LsrR (DeoR family)
MYGQGWPNPTLETHGVFEYKGLGINAGRIWQFLHHHHLRPGQIALATGISSRTISRVLADLRQWGLVEKSDQRWTAVLNADFKLLGEQLGTAKINQHRTERIELERRLFRQFNENGRQT